MMSRIRPSTLVVIGTDCMGSYKSKLPYDHDQSS
jgi:hypothetical protein